MNDRDLFAKAIRGMPTEHIPERFNADVIRLMKKNAEMALYGSEWFNFSDTINEAFLETEALSLAPALSEGLIDIPYPRCGFIMPIDCAGRTIKYILTIETFGNVASEKRWVVDTFVVIGDEIWPQGICEVTIRNHGSLRVYIEKVEPKHDDGCGHDAVSVMITGLSMLVTTGVDRRKVEFKPKVAQQRAARGLPSSPITVVETRRWMEAARETARITAGGHGSPRTHLRRGHVRTFSDGGRTWVRACIVNADSASGAVKREIYQVKSSKGNIAA